MKAITMAAIALGLFLVTGCGNAADVTAPEKNQTGEVRALIRPPQLDRWNWGSWIFHVNEEQSRIEPIPVRELNLHYNVLKFVEKNPCPNCLKIGSPQPQGDGTFKVDVSIRHPFPGQPEYTGFDVRGTVVFAATHYWRDNKLWMQQWTPGGPGEKYYVDDDGGNGVWLFFSRASAGGGQVLNNDGYSFYLHPGFPPKPGWPPKPKLPIHNYQDGKYATASEAELDSTVNPYIEFHNVDERRMFTCDGFVTRTYHIDPPEGAFKFGYIVDASWAPPSNTPVTNPAIDFPDWANAEEGVILEINQVNPLSSDPPEPLLPILEWTFRHIHDDYIKRYRQLDVIMADLMQPGSYWQPVVRWVHDFTGFGKFEMLDPWTSKITAITWPAIIPHTPGNYLAVGVSTLQIEYDKYMGDKAQSAYFLYSPLVDVFELYVEG
jgi:hypothetical protein